MMRTSTGYPVQWQTDRQTDTNFPNNISSSAAVMKQPAWKKFVMLDAWCDQHLTGSSRNPLYGIPTAKHRLKPMTWCRLYFHEKRRKSFHLFLKKQLKSSYTGKNWSNLTKRKKQENQSVLIFLKHSDVQIFSSSFKHLFVHKLSSI